MTTQHDERAMLIERLTFLANSDSGLSVIAQDTCRKAAALLAADGQAGGEAVAWQTRNRYCHKWEPCSKAFYDEFRFGKETHGVEVRELYATHHQPQAVAQGWKLVPVEPTQKMISAAWQQGSGGGWDMEGPEPIYRAMLDASPAEPAAAQDIDWLPHDDRLRFVQRVLESDAPKADRNSAAKMVRDMRLSIRPAAAQVAQPLKSESANRCQANLRDAGLPYPRTCEVCRLGPCRFEPKAAKGIGKDQG